MPRIFDNINLKLEKALKESLELSYRADFCVVFFNLRGWHVIDDYIDKFEGGEGQNCRLLIGMQKTTKLFERFDDSEFKMIKNIAAFQKLTHKNINKHKKENTYYERIVKGEIL